MNIWVAPSFKKKNVEEIFDNVCAQLAAHGITMYFDGDKLGESGAFCRDCLPRGAVISREAEGIPQCGAIVCIGGDGTIIDGAKLSARYQKPVVGVNAGRLGFLAQVEPDMVDSCLTRFIAGDYRLLPRDGISASLDGRRVIDFALNDIVLSKLNDENIVDFELFCDGKPMDAYRADGIILSTATGSTAYSLSAGGPVVDPTLASVCVVPLCPHSVTTRPVVFSAGRTITIKPASDVVLIADGRLRVPVAAGASVAITRSVSQALFIDFGDFEFFEILTAKIKQRG